MRLEPRSSYLQETANFSTPSPLLNSKSEEATYSHKTWVRKNSFVWKSLSSDTNNFWFPWVELISLFPSSQLSDCNLFPLKCHDAREHSPVGTSKFRTNLCWTGRRSREHCLFLNRNCMAFLPSVWLRYMKLLWEHFISVLLFLLQWACSYYFSVTQILFLNIKLWLWKEVLYS